MNNDNSCDLFVIGAGSGGVRAARISAGLGAKVIVAEGLYLGGSTAINVAGAVAMAREMGPGHTIVTILCDSGQRYQSKVWNPEFLRSKSLPVPSWLETA